MKTNTANADIRQRAQKAGLPLWRLAEKAGIADTTLSKWLRMELKPADPRRTLILSALQELEQERTGGRNGEEETQNTAVPDR